MDNRSDTRTTPVTTWSLHMTAPDALVPAGAPGPGPDIRFVRSEVPSPEFSRFLYTAVGGDHAWTDRLAWPYARWQEYLDRPGVETWVAYDRGTPAGYAELAPGDPGPEFGGAGPVGGAASVEIVYFGLLPAFQGRRIGGHLLTHGVRRAWDLAERHPELPPTRRVWLHTCSKDGEHAMANYERRGFTVFATKTEDEPDVPAPGPWPGARPAASPAPAGTSA
ncbi:MULTISPECIES: GNAT family N-acetyltransferase [Streptomyces]|uniref:GNAT family N-acetyltransferase n=1 Tax=Streptomyces TaxID=1883 RepID=UPI00163D0988|nr:MULTISPECIES: GNAT family N-acetyltransferase [Streptomyces]MBC2877536.1 GNAT family N-acetyltransferase [Streptomyces sp. TYQ1024]UBI36222.1 GNAT family N-acetyltransferase [Streptomyces mobaraensis]UKW28816.1 GNAT family N-acetyltransferase [Streptomyces sp. TYQ1024]